MDIEDIFNNLIVGAFIILGICVFIIIWVLINMYINWLEPLGAMSFFVLSYIIGKYVRGNIKK